MNNIINLTTPTEQQRQRLEKQIAEQNQVGLGWLRFTCSVNHLDYWRECIRKYFRSELQDSHKGWNGYQQSLNGVMSILLAYTPVMTEAERNELGVKRSPNEGYLTVDIPQTALDSLSGEQLIEFLIDVYGCEGVRFTRTDVYYDDYCKIISPEAVHHACKLGGVGVPRYNRSRGWDEYDLRKGRNASFTVYFGSTRSDKMVRFYDKAAESNGEQNCYRWETEFKGKYAEEVQSYLLEALEQAVSQDSIEASLTIICNAYKSLIKGSISFHEIPLGTKPSSLGRNWAKRSPLTWWWKELLAGLDPAKLTVSRVKPSLSGAVDWIKSQVAPSLALIRLVYKDWGMPFNAWLQSVLEDGEARWSQRHAQIIRDACLTSPAF